MTTVAVESILPVEAKKVPAPRKRSASTHPSYFEMVKDAIVTLKERTGSSQYAITKFIEEKQKNLPQNFRKLLLVQLRKLVANGKLTTVKHSYKLPPGKKSTPSSKPKSKVAAKHKPKSKSVMKTKAVTPGKPKAAGKRKAPEESKAEKKKPAKTSRTSTGLTPSKVKKIPAAVKRSPGKANTAKMTPAKEGIINSTIIRQLLQDNSSCRIKDREDEHVSKHDTEI